MRIFPEPIVLFSFCIVFFITSLISFIIKDNVNSSSYIANFINEIGGYKYLILFSVFSIVAWLFFLHQKEVDYLNSQLRKQNFENIKKWIVGSIRFDLINHRRIYNKISELKSKSNNHELLKTPEIEAFILEQCKKGIYPILDKLNIMNLSNEDIFGYKGNFETILRYAYMEIDINSFKKLYDSVYEEQS